MNTPLDKRILLDRSSHVRYGHPSFDRVKEFMHDFGLVKALETEEKIFYRGFGRDQFVYVAEKTDDGKRRFKGGAWIVQSMAELGKAAMLPGATPIHDYDAPGGGKVVIVKDILGGEVTLIHGQQDRDPEPGEVPPLCKWNTWHEKNRKGEFQRPETNSPSKVHKLGHYGFEVPGRMLDEITDWYTSTFNLAKSDSLYKPGTKENMMHFLHVDKGEEYVDHHNLFIAGGHHEEGIKAHHTSFEVDDLDSQLVGHHYLVRKGWINIFGLGRHVLGSQIFDYWFDPNGFVVEHYVDGDLVNCNSPVGLEPAIPSVISSWGPDIPKSFFSKKLEDVPGLTSPPPPFPVEA